MWSSGPPGSPAGQRQTIVANFRNRAAAESAWRQITNSIPEVAEAKLIGESLLLAFPMNADEHRLAFFDRIQLLSTNAAVDSTNFHVSFRLSCVASNEVQATAIENEMAAYLEQTVVMHLIPPWSPDVPAPDRQRFVRARRTYSMLDDVTARIYTNAALTALSKQILAARRAGDSARLARLTEEETRKREQLRNEAILRVRNDAQADPALIDAYNEWSKQRESLKAIDYRNAMRKFGERLGQLPLRGGEPEPAVLRHSTLYGACHRAGLLINFYGVTFHDAAAGVPAMIEWLCHQGCIGFQYDFELGMSPGDIDPDDL